MALHPCFQPASLTPHSTPLQNLALRSGLEAEESHRPGGDSVVELSGGTGRQCRRAARRHWGQCSGAVRHGGSPMGPDHRASPTLRQFEGTWPPSSTYTDVWFTATATGTSPSPGARSLASQALQHEGTLHAGVGAAVPSTVPEEWDPPSWAGWPTSWCPSTAGSAQLTSARCPREVRDYISICERCTVVPCFRKKKRDMMLGMVVR